MNHTAPVASHEPEDIKQQKKDENVHVADPTDLVFTVRLSVGRLDSGSPCLIKSARSKWPVVGQHGCLLVVLWSIYTGLVR